MLALSYCLSNLPMAFETSPCIDVALISDDNLEPVSFDGSESKIGKTFYY